MALEIDAAPHPLAPWSGPAPHGLTHRTVRHADGSMEIQPAFVGTGEVGFEVTRSGAGAYEIIVET